MSLEKIHQFKIAIYITQSRTIHHADMGSASQSVHHADIRSASQSVHHADMGSASCL